jgi:cyanophycin synthetase
MADYTSAATICYVTMTPSHPLVKEHIRAGGRAVVLEEGMNGHMITLYDKGAHMPLLWTHLIPATLEGKALHNVQNAMFAAAMAHSLGTRLEDVRQGLRTFDATFFQAPGRMNVFDEHPFKVILDYGHNPAALRVMCDLVDRLDRDGRAICVLAAPGDRRDEDIREMASVAAGHFDHYICRRDDGLRGRGPKEVPEMLASALRAAGVDDTAIELIPDEREAVQTGLSRAEPGDLLLIFADNLARTWKQVTQFRPQEDEVTAPAAGAGPGFELPELAATFVVPDDRLIRDKRGVRVARDEESD